MPAHKRRRQQRQRSFFRLTWRRALVLATLASIGVGVWLFMPFWRLSGQFVDQSSRQPSRLYGRPQVIEPGTRMTPEQLVESLEGAGYEARSSVVERGTFRRDGSTVELYRRRFPSPRGMVGGDLLRIDFGSSQVKNLVRNGQALAGVWIDPPLIASFYGDDLQERRPITLDQLPEDLILSVLAAEDASFLEHGGLSVRGILRAAWANFQANEVRQGGSTLTQQLVKNLYLTHDRRMARKLQEALLAILLESRYDKRLILQAYLNEIYWGRSGSVDLMGIGAAAWAYFEKPAEQLSLSESALLAGIIQSPGNLSPLRNLDGAKARRDVVLGRLSQLRWIEPARLEAAANEPINARPGSLVARQAPYFSDLMVAEARRRFGIEDLDDAGLTLHSTLDLRAQRIAENTVRDEIAILEEKWEKKRTSPLQAAMIAVDPDDGGILAYLGGRDYRSSQFDRASQARRQAGSIFKPIVYAAAFEDRLANPATFLQDSPYSLTMAGKVWTPKNSKDEFHGWVTARTALEQSYNVPTARLAVEMGLDKVVDMANRLGVDRELKALPALALGAMEVSPLEMATVYATFATGGVRPELHGLVAAFDARGQQIEPTVALAQPRRVVDAGIAFLVNKVLQGVPIRGTGKGLRARGFTDPVAAKTGTSNDRRDSWFVGYSPERATLVWVGYDDNSRTRLSGARGALPIWSTFSKATRPAGGFGDFPAPTGVVMGYIDPRTGSLAHQGCSERQQEFFLRDFVPEANCADDGAWQQRLRVRGDRDDTERKRHPFGRWLKMLREGDG